MLSGSGPGSHIVPSPYPPLSAHSATLSPTTETVYIYKLCYVSPLLINMAPQLRDYLILYWDKVHYEWNLIDDISLLADFQQYRLQVMKFSSCLSYLYFSTKVY